MKSLLCFYSALFLISGCNRLSNRVDDLAVQCSVPAQSTGRFLKVLNPQGQSFQGEAAKRLQANIIDANGTKSSLRITDGGCIQLPTQSGLVSVVDSSSHQSFSIDLGPGLDLMPSVIVQSLQPLNDFALNLACPAEGLYADDSLKSPENLILSGDMRGLEFRVDLYSSSKQFIRHLFEKKLGQAAYLHDKSVYVSDLPEGAYFVKLYGSHVANGLNSEPALLNGDKDCSLFIIHGAVKIKGMDESSFVVVSKGSALNWKAEKFGEQLFVCREARNGKYETGNSAETCQPRFTCQESVNFQRVDEMITQEAGVFDYYAFAKDQLGRKSPLACQTVIVSDASPTLAVEWDAEDLKPIGSVLRKPYATIKAHASIDHGLLDRKSLAKNLECKASFELKGRDDLSGSSVFCTSGRCEGMTMGKFVPCDEDIALSLVEAWEQPVVGRSRFKLEVRTSDGAGHFSEAEASFWINNSTWKTDTLSFIEAGKTRSIETFSVTKKGVVLGFFFGESFYDKSFARYFNGTWEKYPGLKDFVDVEFAHAVNGPVSAFVRYRDYEDISHIEYWQFDDDGLVTDKLSVQENFQGNCQDFSIDPTGRLWCFDSESARYFSENSWHDMPDFKSFGLSIQTWRIFRDGRVFGLSFSDAIIYQPGQGWSRLNLKGDHYLFGVVEDLQGHAWIVSSSKITGVTDLLYKIGPQNELKEFSHPKPAGLFASTVAEANSSPIARLKLGFYEFDFGLESWEKIPTLNSKPSASMGMMFDFLNFDGRATMVANNHGFYEFGNESLYWPLKNMGVMCFCNSVVRSIDDQMFLKAERGGLTELVRIAPNRASKFDGGMAEYQGNFSIDNWIDKDGVPVFALGSSNMIRLKGDSIQTLPTELPKSTLRVYPLAGDRYCQTATDSVSIIRSDSTRTPVLISNTGEMYFDCVEDSEQKLWFYKNNGREFGYVRLDGSFKPVVEMANSDERVTSAYAFDFGRRILVALTSKILIISVETDFISEIGFPKGMQILQFEPVSTHEYSFELMDEENQRFRYLLDDRNSQIRLDESFMNLKLSYYSTLVQHRGDKAWIVGFADNDEQFLLIREAGVWKFLANSKQFRPWGDMPAPLSFAPDLAGHIWFLSRSPNYEFYRYDP